MFYINRYAGRDIETVDSFRSRAEARAMVQEYRTADGSASYRLSTRATRIWRQSEADALRPARVAPVRPVLAYFDSFAGLVPCRIVSAVSDSSGAIRFDVQFTGRGRNLPTAYKAGETADGMASRKIVPRDSIARRCGSAFVRAYSWRAKFPELATLRHVTA